MTITASSNQDKPPAPTSILQLFQAHKKRLQEQTAEQVCQDQQVQRDQMASDAYRLLRIVTPAYQDPSLTSSRDVQDTVEGIK